MCNCTRFNRLDDHLTLIIFLRLLGLLSFVIFFLTNFFILVSFAGLSFISCFSGNLSFGGACFPKDTIALNEVFKKYNVQNEVLQAVIEEILK